MDRKKKLITLFLTSAMAVLWACGEGDISAVTDKDEVNAKKIADMSDSDFLAYYEAYCKKQKDCKIEYNSSSSVAKSSSSKAKSSSSVKSSSSGKGPGSSATSSASGKGSSSSTKTSSSSKGKGSSSSTAPVIPVSGKCNLIKPDVVHVGDDVIWTYLPDENSIESASYEWEVNAEVGKSIISGDLTGTGLPQIVVKFMKTGTKYGPTLTFAGKEFDCENLKVVEADTKVSSSSVVASSSSKVEESSSSVPPSSSSVAPVGHCEASKHEIEVGEPVDVYIADPDGNVVTGKYNWRDLGTGAELKNGVQKSDDGSTKITIVYSIPGEKELQGQFPIKQKSLMCDKVEGEPFLNVKDKPGSSSSSSEEIEESSSSTAAPKSSSSKTVDPCEVDPEGCVV